MSKRQISERAVERRERPGIVSVPCLEALTRREGRPQAESLHHAHRARTSQGASVVAAILQLDPAKAQGRSPPFVSPDRALMELLLLSRMECFFGESIH